MSLRASVFFIILAFSLYSSDGTFTTPPTPIATPVNSDVTSCVIQDTNQVMFTWKGNSSSASPYYAIYDIKQGGFTTPPTLIDATYIAGVWNIVFCCYNSRDNEVVFSWNDGSQNHPYYAIYDVAAGNFIKNPTKIDSTYSAGVWASVFCCYNSIDNQVVFSWNDDSSNGNPYYAIYNANTKSFRTLPTLIDATYSAGTYIDVFCCYNSKNNQIIFSWSNYPILYPYYAIYDATTASFTTLPTLIDPAYTTPVYKNVFCCYNSKNNQVTFSWSDYTHHNPYYAIYDVTATSFTTPPTLIDPAYSTGAYYNLFCCYNNIDNQVIFCWMSASHPYYAIYDVAARNFTTSPTLIDPTYSTVVPSDVFCSYNSNTNQTFFSWVSAPGTLDSKLWYTIFTQPIRTKNKAYELLKNLRYSSVDTLKN